MGWGKYCHMKHKNRVRNSNLADQLAEAAQE